MIKLTVEQVARLAGGVAFGEGEVVSIAIDSRKVIPGSLYIAIKGQRLDGHAFIGEACEHGAAAVMAHSDCECAVPVVRVDDTTKALLRFAGAYRDMFSPFLIALTGSVGKTSTKDMTYCALAESRKTIKTDGNLNNHIGMPLNLLRLDETVEAAVIEMGMSARGEISRLTRAAKPDAAIITNIGISHIGLLGSRREILNAKMEIVEGMKPGGTLILNGDDDMLSGVAEPEGIRIIRYSLLGEGDVSAEILREGDNHSEVRIKTASGEYDMVVPAGGRHNVYNALGAFTAASVAGADPLSAIRGIGKFRPAAMRQSVYEKGGVTVIEDCYNAAPDSMSAALSLLSRTGGGRRVAVLSDMVELGDYSPAAHERVGREAASVADLLMIYGNFAADYERGFNSVDGRRGMVEIFPDKAALTQALKETLREGDAVLFKASRAQRLEEVIEKVFPAEERE
ncbi:MAG: UDP-N-acetylmuramoyl-tripeptide--D-alanyl-D-alanine ligase [Clostridia bacterium]|nr:UDP-N-acetylmuramoyl-tripeptide--D-alanyl-D-alanine ligase [Clostridia bacterium]